MAQAAAEGLRKIAGGAIAVALIILAAIAFILFSALGQTSSAAVDTAAGNDFPCTVQSVYDGDGPINCAETDTAGKRVRVRLRGIEAREADNSCRYEDLCPEASGAEAKAHLTRLAVGQLECVSFGPSYNNVDASCRNRSGQDVSCEMLRSGAAVRWPQYDPDGRLLACVPAPR
ncbi:MAG: hypothetical protein JWL74_1550 [Alphaproteobacteria bacterium]|nr:hypothetical protein [Alphaproteobacteria bacterium]